MFVRSSCIILMGRIGFGERWIKWIIGCMEFAFVFVLVKGSPNMEFSPHRGLKQCDPIASIVAEGLSELMRQALHSRIFSSYKVGKHQVEVSLLQFADDTLFFAEANPHNVLVIKSMLR